MAEAKIFSPEECPECYKEDIAKIDDALKFIYRQFQVPYAIQAKIARQRYVSIMDLADRWSLDTIRDKAPTDLGFEALEYDADDKAFYAVRLLQAVRHAQVVAQSATQPGLTGGFGSTGPILLPQGSEPGTGPSSFMLEKNQKAKLYTAWKIHTSDPAPKLNEVGSMTMVKQLWATLEGGEFGTMEMKQIIPAQLEINERPQTKSTWEKSQYGNHVEVIVETVRFPQDRSSWEKSLKIWKNTLLMVQWNFPQFSQFNLEKDDLDRFYDFVLGRSIASRSPPPQLVDLIHTERNAWKEINISMREGDTAKVAVNKCINNHLFWLAAINGTQNQPATSSWNSQPPNHKFQRSQQRNRQRKGWQQKQWTGEIAPTWPKGKQHYHKGNGKGIKDGGKTWKQGYKGAKPGKKGEKLGKGKLGKGKPGKGKGGNKGGAKWPPTWARVDKQGKEYCQNFHIRGGCSSNPCLRSHKCPKQSEAMDWICNQDHKAENCPNYA